MRRHRLIWPLTATGLGLGLTSGAVLACWWSTGSVSSAWPRTTRDGGWLFSASGVGALGAGLALCPLARCVNDARITLVALSVNLVVRRDR